MGQGEQHLKRPLRAQSHLKDPVHLASGAPGRAPAANSLTLTHSLLINHRPISLAQQHILRVQCWGLARGECGDPPGSLKCDTQHAPAHLHPECLAEADSDPITSSPTGAGAHLRAKRERLKLTCTWEAGGRSSGGWSGRSMGSAPSSVPLGKSLTLPESLSCLTQKLRRLEHIVLKSLPGFTLVEKCGLLGEYLGLPYFPKITDLSENQSSSWEPPFPPCTHLLLLDFVSVPEKSSQPCSNL